ncbi:MAG TPA: BON domain-containing protein [Candidatus Elarobacter sp.]|nr:BON domain-containing protein [Candidatus Elarobacter sp.]
MERDFEDIFDTEDLNADELKRLVRETLRDNRSIDPLDINVHVREGKVILSGRVGTDAEKRIAERVVGDRIGLVNVESQLVVDPLRRAESPEAADEHLADEENHEGLLLGERSDSQSDTAEHLRDDEDAESFGTVDRTEAIEDGVPWIPPESPTPEGTDEAGIPHDAERDSF